MPCPPKGPSQYLARFSEQPVPCSQYTLAKLGIDRNRCSLKIDKYVMLCIPFQFGFRRSFFIVSLSRNEQVFFHKYLNTIANLSLSFSLPNQMETLNFFIRCTLVQISPIKDRNNLGVFVVDFKNLPNELVMILGDYLSHQEKLRFQYEDYGNVPIQITPEAVKTLGYNTYAVISGETPQGKRIQLLSLSSKTMEYLEPAAVPLRNEGDSVSYNLFFKKYRIVVSGFVETAKQLPQGIIRSAARLNFSPELVEILDDYWLQKYNISKAEP